MQFLMTNKNSRITSGDRQYSTFDPPDQEIVSDIYDLRLQTRLMTHQHSTFDPPIRLMTHQHQLIYIAKLTCYGVINICFPFRLLTH